MPGRSRGRCLVEKWSACQGGSVQAGSRTESITWITPLVQAMSVFTTVDASLSLTPFVVLIASMAPLTVLADCPSMVITSEAITAPGPQCEERDVRAAAVFGDRHGHHREPGHDPCGQRERLLPGPSRGHVLQRRQARRRSDRGLGQAHRAGRVAGASGARVADLSVGSLRPALGHDGLPTRGRLKMPPHDGLPTRG
eukprot:gene406-578_t